MDVVPFPVGKAFSYEMPPVARGIDDGVRRFDRRGALQDGLQGREVVIVFLEGQVIDEDDELQRIVPQRLHDLRDVMQLALLHLEEPQSFPGQFIGDRFDGGRLARAGRAVQQGVGGGFPVEQSTGVGKELFLLMLVPVKVREGPGVGRRDGDDFLPVQPEHDVVCIHAVPGRADLRDALFIGLRKVPLRRLEGRQKAGAADDVLPMDILLQFFRGQVGKLLEQVQFFFDTGPQYLGNVFPFGAQVHITVLILRHSVEQEV